MNKITLTRYINVAIFAILLGALINAIKTTDISDLKTSCVLLIVYVLIDLFGDIKDSKGEK